VTGTARRWDYLIWVQGWYPFLSSVPSAHRLVSFVGNHLPILGRRFGRFLALMYSLSLNDTTVIRSAHLPKMPDHAWVASVGLIASEIWVKILPQERSLQYYVSGLFHIKASWVLPRIPGSCIVIQIHGLRPEVD